MNNATTVQKTISIREFCIPAYDWLSRVNSVAEQNGVIIPVELSEMEQKTAGGICAKVAHFWAAPFWKELPTYATIKSGAMNLYMWNKDEQGNEAQRIALFLAD